MVAYPLTLSPTLSTPAVALWQKASAHSFVVRLREAIAVARQLLAASQRAIAHPLALASEPYDLFVTGIVRALTKLSDLWHYLQAYKRAAEAERDTELIARLYDLVYTLRFALNWSRVGPVVTINEVSPQAATQAALQLFEPFIIRR